MAKSLYQRLVEAGVQTASWQSDLYFPLNADSLRVLEEARAAGVYSGKPKTFVSETDGKMWFDAPFQYDPFWEKRRPRTLRREG